MAEVTAITVKELREKTGAGMMDCKKALGETNGDVEAAVDWLRKKGPVPGGEKSGRVAAEGLVAVTTTGTTAAIVEVNSETDFVARNDKFQAFAAEAAQGALKANGDVEGLKTAPAANGKTYQETMTDLIATIGENMNLRRATHLSVTDGVVAAYVHNAVVPNLGKIGVLVALESTGDKAALNTLGKQIAMHIAAAKPESLDVASIDPKALDRERDVLREQAKASGKPDAVVEKMVEGRVRKYYEEVVLLEQPYVITGEGTVQQAVDAAGKQLGTPVKVTGFIRYALGEGIEKQETDFAAEVQAALAG